MNELALELITGICTKCKGYSESEIKSLKQEIITLRSENEKLKTMLRMINEIEEG